MTVERSHWAYYQTKDLAMVPYMEGTPVYKDGMLPFLYTKTREEGKIESVFCGDILNMDSFVDFFVKRKTMQVLCEIEDDKTLRPVGYSWLDNPIGVDGARGVLCGFCFFNGASKRESARDLGKLGLAYWFIAMKVDVVHGILLESNTAARNYALRVGFKEVGIVPKRHFHNGTLEGARVMMIERSDFEPAFDEWYEEQKGVAELVG